MAAGGFGVKAATSFWVEQVSKWNCVQRQSGIQWFTEKRTGCHFTLGANLCVAVVVTVTNTMGVSKPHSFTPQTGAFHKHSPSSNSNGTIRSVEGRFIPYRKGQPCYGRVSKYFYFYILP